MKISGRTEKKRHGEGKRDGRKGDKKGGRIMQKKERKGRGNRGSRREVYIGSSEGNGGGKERKEGRRGGKERREVAGDIQERRVWEAVNGQ